VAPIPMLPLISVITPVFNAQDVLPYAIESVLSQTYQTLELVIVDDASTDGSAWIAEHYARIDNRIKVVHNPRNSRIGPIEWEARNDGLKIATGTLVAYLDADNAWHPDFLARLSTVLLSRPDLELVHCDSRNYYSATDKQLAVARDRRKLQAEGQFWTVFSNGPLNASQLGAEQYIDTNEMLHRASVFHKLRGLWNTTHPKREWINGNQGNIRPFRRHNDLDLFERVLERCGPDSIRHVDEVLVDFYYQSFPRQPHPVSLTAPSRRSLELDAWLGLQPENRKPSDTSCSTPVNVDRTCAWPLLDFGVGEVAGLGRTECLEIWDRFIRLPAFYDSIAKYSGSSAYISLYAAIAAQHNARLGSDVFDHDNVVPCNGCTDAIQHAIAIYTNAIGRGSDRSGVAFAVPGYSYWNIVRTASRRPVAIECYDADAFLNGLSRMRSGSIGAVIIPWPHNPYGYLFSHDQIVSLARLVQLNKWGLIVDLAYESLLHNQEITSPLRCLDVEQAIFCSTVSKSWGLPGFRLGFAVAANSTVAATIRSRKYSQTLMPSGVTQLMGTLMLQHYSDIPQRVSAMIRDRRVRLRAAITSEISSDLGVTLSPISSGLFETLHITDFCRAIALTSSQVSAMLLV
jgi:aspartate/methionine/tyrosine aminotransferase/glycosyltransferase involved in cell wall biosynthesis